MYDVYKRGLCLGACAAGLAIAALGEADAEAAAKTWALTLPEDAAGVTNKAPVTLTDGNYVLRGYIVSAHKSTGSSRGADFRAPGGARPTPRGRKPARHAASSSISSRWHAGAASGASMK